MKKTFMTLLAIVLSLSLLIGCSKAINVDQNLSTQASSKIASEFTDAIGVFNGIIDGDSVQFINKTVSKQGVTFKHKVLFTYMI